MQLAELDEARRTVETPVGPISYLDVGSGPFSLYVHGLGTNALLWRNVIDEVRHERRCIALDLPLHGHTPAADGQDFTLNALAEVLEQFCAALDLPPVDLVANDSGGAVCQVFAAHHPERLATMTLTNCDTQGNLPPKAFMPTVLLARAGLLALSGPTLVKRPSLARRQTFGGSYEHPELLSDEIIRAFLTPVVGTRARGRQFHRWILSLHDKDLRAVEPQLKALDVPTLIVWGTGDKFFDIKYAHWLRDTIPGATEVIKIEGGRLFFPDERADELVPHLRKHWAAHARI